MHVNLMGWAQKYGIKQEALGELFQLLNPLPPTTQRGEGEAHTQAMIRLDAAEHGRALWRNNNGVLPDKNGRPVRFGLGNDSKKINEVFKSSDLIGITPMNYGGHLVGVFTAIEVKHEDWTGPTTERDKAQANYMNTVKAMGGFATFATSVEDYRHATFIG